MASAVPRVAQGPAPWAGMLLPPGRSSQEGERVQPSSEVADKGTSCSIIGPGSAQGSLLWSRASCGLGGSKAPTSLTLVTHRPGWNNTFH